MLSGLVTSLTPRSGPPELQKISLSADRQANHGAPVAVDLVLVLEPKPFALLATLRAGEWFNNKTDLLRQHQNRLVVVSWEIVPGQSMTPTEIPSTNGNLVGVLIFADYLGEQTYRADATGMREVQVYLAKDGFEIAPTLLKSEVPSAVPSSSDRESPARSKYKEPQIPRNSAEQGVNVAPRPEAERTMERLAEPAARSSGCVNDSHQLSPGTFCTRQVDPVQDVPGKVGRDQFVSISDAHRPSPWVGEWGNRTTVGTPVQPRFIPRPIREDGFFQGGEQTLHLRTSKMLQFPKSELTTR